MTTDLDPEARTGSLPPSERPGLSMSWDAIRGIAAAVSVVVVVGGIMWTLSAQAERVRANSDAVEKLDCLPVQMARVEEKVTALGVQLSTQQGTLEAILNAAQREKD